MSVLQGLKGTFQSVQQDLVDGFKALTSFESPPNSEVLKRLRGDGVNLDAGADLLYRYHTSWREIDSYSKESAKRAEGVDEEINEIYKRWSKQDNLVYHLDQSVKQIPILVQVLSNLTASLGELEESFRIVEDDLEKLEDVCEEQELVKQQQQQIHQLQQYRHDKSKEIEKVKVQMARDHAKRMIELEKKRSIKLQERHEAFEEAFTSDLSYYKEHGKADQLKLPEIPKVSSLSDISIDQDEKALNDFLASQTTTPVTDKTIDEENIDDEEIHMEVVVTSEESFIEDDYTKDYGHDINTVPDSDSSEEDNSTISGSKTEDNSKESGSKVEDNSNNSGSKAKDKSSKSVSKVQRKSSKKTKKKSKKSENKIEDNSTKSESKIEDNSTKSESKIEDNSNKSESKVEDNSNKLDSNTENDSKNGDISKHSDVKYEDQTGSKAEDNQSHIQDTTQQSSNETIQTEEITNEDIPKQSDSRSEDNQITDSEVSNDPGNSDKDIPQQSKDQNDNDSKVS